MNNKAANERNFQLQGLVVPLRRWQCLQTMAHVADEEGDEEQGVFCSTYDDLPGLQPWVVAQLKQLSQ